MSNFLNILFLLLAIIFAIFAGILICKIILNKRNSREQEKLRREAAGINGGQFKTTFAVEGFAKKILYYMVKIAYELSFISNESKISMKLFKSNELKIKYKELAKKASMPEIFGNYALKETQIRLAFMFCLGGALIGCVFSNILMFILFVSGLLIGFYLPIWALKQEKQERTNKLESFLPEMLDVIALGLRSGLTFDRSFQIYTSHFENNFSNECKTAQQKWENGICLREDALRSLAKTYDSPVFSRVVENIIRSLRFGSSLVESLEEAASESRTIYKTKQEEMVAKAPVKMMIPTGTLILPAMLIMILGPVLLELTGGF